MPRDPSAEPLEDLDPINISDLEENMLVQHRPDNLRFTQNSVPFDFDGEHLIYMEYQENSMREIHMYKVSTREVTNLLRFTKADQIVSHVKLATNMAGDPILVYAQAGRQIKTYDIKSKTHQLVAMMPDSILAMHVRQNVLRPSDRAAAGNNPNDPDESSRMLMWRYKYNSVSTCRPER